jgi:hypothetical protein
MLSIAAKSTNQNQSTREFGIAKLARSDLGSTPKSHYKIKVIPGIFGWHQCSLIDERDHVREQLKENFGGIK